MKTFRTAVAAALVSMAIVATTLIAAPLGHADPPDGYTAVGSPAAVQPLTVSTYTITLTNKSNSPDSATQATLSVPSGFSVDPPTLSAATADVPACTASAWSATLNAAGTQIDLASPDSGSGALCPGGTLTIQFQATAPSAEATYTWTTQLQRDSTVFARNGADPSVQVDGTPPSAPTITAKPALQSNSANAGFTFTDSEPNLQFECRLDGAAFVECTSPTTYSALGDGSHTFDVVAVDAAGNTSSPTPYAWSIDTVSPPAPSIDAGPSAASGSSSASFSFSDAELGTSFDCRLDGGTFSACNSPKSYTGLANGPHTFGVRARDAAGNTSAETTYSWTIDTVPPVVTITSGPAPATNQTSASFDFSSNELASGFECTLDAGSFAPCTSPARYTSLSDGPHTFRVRATDSVGNTGVAATYAWTVDTVAPTVTLTSKPAMLTNDPTPSFTFSASEPGSTFSCKLDGGDFAACTNGVTYGTQGDGGHTFAVTATDAAGNTGAEATYSWTIDATPPPAPTLQSSPPEVTASTSATFAFSNSDPSVGFECRLDAAGFSSCNSPKDYIGLGDGTHAFRVRARDAAGNASAVTAYDWTVDTVNPVVTITSGPAPATNQTSAAFSFSSNKPGSTFECSLDSTSSFTPCTSPKTYSSVADGPHTFRVRAKDSGGNTGVATPYKWSVDTVAPPSPALGGGPPAATNQTSASFAFSDGESASFTCRLDGEAFTSCQSPQSYPGLADGPHTFEVRAADAVGNTSSPASYNWTVDTVAPDTAISSGPDLNSSSGTASFTFASNEAGVSFACSVDGGAFSPCSSPQTYSGLADGNHSLAVRAVDAAGNVDPTPASYLWTVATPRVPDTTPPGRVGRLASAVGYRLFRLSWTLPADPDFDHVSVFVSTSKRGPLQTTVYTGKGTAFTNKRFRNGSYYRFAVISYDRAGNHSGMSTVAVSPSALLRSPRNGAVIRKPPLLTWALVRGAKYYNVQVVYGGRKVLSAWPKRSQLQLRQSWTYGGARRLKKGSYAWYVWPGFGARSAAHYGQLLGQGSFVVR